jgi:transmembrane sensor
MEFQMNNERRWELAVKELTGSITKEERSELEDFLLDEDFKNAFTAVQNHWSRFGSLPYEKIDVAEGWQVVHNKITAQRPRITVIRRMNLLKYAAAFLLFLVSVSFLMLKSGLLKTEERLTTIEAPAGARTYITLPDSSTVWLNAGSKITYGQEFGEKHRELSLSGEAFFDVRKGETLFQVHTADFDVAVLGTAFNINAYTEDDAVSTTLVRGSLKVSRTGPNGSEYLILAPNEKVTIKGNFAERIRTSMMKEKNINGTADGEWKDGWLTAQGENLEQLTRKIERLYGVKISFENENLKNFKYTGRIQQLSLEQVLRALALTSPVAFELKGRNVFLKEDQSSKAKYNNK